MNMAMWWQSVFNVGKPLLPYAGLVLLALAVIALIVLLVWMALRSGRRVPAIGRYLGWRLRTTLARLRASWRARQGVDVRVRLAGSDTTVSIRRVMGSPGRRASRSMRRAVYFTLTLRPELIAATSAVTDDMSWRPVDAVVTDRSTTFELSALFEGRGQQSRQRAFRRACMGLGAGLAPDAIFIDIDCALPEAQAMHMARAAASVIQRPVTVVPMAGLASSDSFVAHPADITERAAPASGMSALASGSTDAAVFARSGGATRFAAHFDYLGRLLATRGWETPIIVRFTGLEQLPGYDALHTLSVSSTRSLRAWRGYRRLDTAEASTVPDLWEGALVQQVRDATLAASPSHAELAVDCLRLPGALAQCRQFLTGTLDALGVALRNHAAQAALVEVGVAGDEASFDARARRADVGPAWSYPMTEAWRLRNRRRLLVARAVLVCSALLLLRWVPATLSGTAELEQQLQLGMNDVGDYARLAPGDGAQPDLATAERLLVRIAQLDQVPRRFVLAPSSWLWHDIDDVMAALARQGYRILVAPRMIWLAKRTGEPDEAGNDAARSGTPPAVLSSDALPATAQMLEFMTQQERIRSIDERTRDRSHTLTYQDVLALLGSDRPGDGESIVWSDALPAAATSMMGERESVDDPQFVQQRLRLLWERVLTQAFEQAPVMLHAQQTVTGCAALASGDAAPADVHTLGVSIQALLDLQQRAGSNQVVGTPADSARYFEATLVRLSQTPLLSTQAVAEMTAAIQRRRDAVRAQLVGMQAVGVGALFENSANGTLTPAAPLRDLRNALNLPDLQRFAVDESRPAVFPSGALYWDHGAFVQTGELGDAWTDFQTHGTQVFNAALRGGASAFVRARYQQAVIAAIVQLAMTRSDLSNAGAPDDVSGPLRERADGLARMAHVLHAAFPDLAGSPDRVIAVHDRLAQEVNATFAQLSAQWNRDSPYAATTRLVTDWIRSAPPDQPLGLTAGGSLGDRLALIRRTVQTDYAASADALLRAASDLQMSDYASTDAQQWHSFLQALGGADKDTFGNGLFRLEQAFRAMDTWQGPDDCRSLPAQNMDTTGFDPFSAAHLQLVREVQSVCQNRRQVQAVRRESGFASWFNRHAAGHMPFADAPGLGELDYEQFLDVLRRYQEAQGTVSTGAVPPPSAGTQATRADGSASASLPADTAPLPPDAQTRAFERRMNALARTFLTPAADAHDGNAPASGVANRLMLREPRDEEVLGDQIIDWSWHSGAHVWALHTGTPVWTWQPGEPVTLTLRFAEGSIWHPVSSGDALPPYTVNGRAVTFSAGGSWALFDLVRTHRVREDASGTLVLAFDIAVNANGARSAQARVFVTLRPQNAQGVLALGVPTHAPESDTPASDTPASGVPLPDGPLPPAPFSPDAQLPAILPARPTGEDAADEAPAQGESIPFELTQAAWTQISQP